MSVFPQQGGSRNTWGTELRNFFSPWLDLNTGLPNEYSLAYVGNTLDISTVNTSGIVNISNVIDGTINLMDFVSSPYPVKIKPLAGTVLTMYGTGYDNITQNGQFLWFGDIQLNGNTRDWIELEQVSITNINGTFTVFKEKARGIM